VTRALEDISDNIHPAVTFRAALHIIDSAWNALLSGDFLNMSYDDMLKHCNERGSSQMASMMDDLLVKKLTSPTEMANWSTHFDSLLALRLFTTQHLYITDLIQVVIEDVTTFGFTDLAEELWSISDDFEAAGDDLLAMKLLLDRILLHPDKATTIMQRMQAIQQLEMDAIQRLNRLPFLEFNTDLLKRICVML